MPRHVLSTGIVLSKKNLLKSDKLIHIFSADFGRIAVFAKGISTITSKRLSHLESGNYIKFSYSVNNEFPYLQETELIYGYSKIRNNPVKIAYLYKILFVLFQILPENQHEPVLFAKTLEMLKELNNKERFTDDNLNIYLSELLIQGGYIDKERTEHPFFNPMSFIEELVGKRISVPSF